MQLKVQIKNRHLCTDHILWRKVNKILLYKFPFVWSVEIFRCQYLLNSEWSMEWSFSWFYDDVYLFIFTENDGKLRMNTKMFDNKFVSIYRYFEEIIFRFWA